MIIKVREFNNDYTDDDDVPYDLLDKAAAEATAVAEKDKDALEAELRKVLGDRLDRVYFEIGDTDEYDEDKGRDHYYFTATVPVTLNVSHKTGRDEYDDVLDKIDSCFGDADLSIEYDPDDSKGYVNDTDALDVYKGYYTYTFETEADT